MALSGWFIDDIELPEAPVGDERSIARSFQAETLFQFFPSITKSSARSFDYTVNGFIYDEVKAVQLDEIAKSADTNTVLLRIPADQIIFNTTKFAVKKLTFSRKGPLFIRYNGVDVQALPYVLTFTELPAEGEMQEGIDGFTEGEEDGIGLNNLIGLYLGSDGISELDFDVYGPISAYQTEVGEAAV